MNASPKPLRSNPFSTRFIRPGAIPFLFDRGDSVEQLIERLASQQWRGQIVGPHGSGKSTLLSVLEDQLRPAGQRAWRASLHDGQRRMPSRWKSAARSLAATMIVVDGYEQLSHLQRWLLRATCYFQGWGLLVTAHRDVGLPTLYRTSADPEIARRVVTALLADSGSHLTAEQVLEAYQLAGGNVRETLFRLYDVWESSVRLAAG